MTSAGLMTLRGSKWGPRARLSGVTAATARSAQRQCKEVAALGPVDTKARESAATQIGMHHRLQVLRFWPADTHRFVSRWGPCDRHLTLNLDPSGWPAYQSNLGGTPR
jgi:hypothetical protein